LNTLHTTIFGLFDQAIVFGDVMKKVLNGRKFIKLLG
jgi:hypothetical protein